MKAQIETKSKKDSQIVCMSFSIKLLRAYFAISKNGNEKRDPRFIICHLICFVNFLGILLHLIYIIKNGNISEMDKDLTIMVALAGNEWMNSFFYRNGQLFLDLCRRFSDFKTYGKPHNFEKFNKRINQLSVCHAIYASAAIFVLLLTSVLEGPLCEELNKERNLAETCGLIANVYFPNLDTNIFPNKQIILITQLLGTWYVVLLSAQIAWVSVECMEHLIFRIKHLKTCFVKALRAESYESRRTGVNFAIKYHYGITDMGHLFNDLFSSVLFLHVLLTGAILGCTAFRIMDRHSLPSLLIFLGWLIGMSISCISGQRLLDECDTIARTIWAENWYHLEQDIQKDLQFVFLRCAKPIVPSVGLGIMSHEMILKVLKASYSFITLLKQTSEID